MRPLLDTRGYVAIPISLETLKYPPMLSFCVFHLQDSVELNIYYNRKAKHVSWT